MLRLVACYQYMTALCGLRGKNISLEEGQKWHHFISYICKKYLIMNLKARKKSELTIEKPIPMSIEQYEEEINQAMSDSKNGKMVKATDLKKEI